MKCVKCQGRGFIEYEHGLVMVECSECGGTGEVADNPKYLILSERMGNGETLEELAGKARDIIGESNDSDSRIRQPNSSDGGGNTSKPKRTRKPKAQKKARARIS